ncbi:MAG: IS1634 family transposase, partial [Syntrophaceae bacterium]|nr:IS1634 family transposase [Syntrophaceae bacterium]
LGPIEKIGMDAVRSLADGFFRIAGGERSVEHLPRLLGAKDFGHVFAVAETWKGLGLSTILSRAGIEGETTFSTTDLIEMMVVNRLCDPCSKLALLEWLDGVYFPGYEESKPPYHHLLRAMDRLIAVKEKAELLIAKRFLSLHEGPVDLVFYDITSTYFEGDKSVLEDDIRKFGYNRDGKLDCRQIVIGIVMTREGIPLCHHVFPGNTVDKSTVASVIRDLKSRFLLDRVVFVGDRGMLSVDNLETILDEELGFIVAHTLRRNAVAVDVIEKLGDRFDRTREEEQFLCDERTSVRFVLAYSPEIALTARAKRTTLLSQANEFINNALLRLSNPSPRGRKPTPQGTYDRIRDYLRDHHLMSLYQIEIEDDRVTVCPNDKTRSWEEKIDGMLLVETTDLTSPPEEVIQRYKELAEIERGWRALKSTLLLRPVHHWTEDRIKAHVFICVLALQIERLMRNRLKTLSVSKALDRLRRIKVGEIKVGDTAKFLATEVTAEQKEILTKLGVPPLPAAFR